VSGYASPKWAWLRITVDSRRMSGAPQELNRNYWQKRFTSGDTPWELGRASRVVCEALAELEARGFLLNARRVLCPGCGTGADAIEVARLGASVIGIDWCDSAVTASKQRASVVHGELRGSLEVRQADFFLAAPEPVDLVCEHTFFCAIDPGLRPRYVERVHKWLSKGGFLAGNFFIIPPDVAPKLTRMSLGPDGTGPPFACTEQELLKLTADYFEPVLMRPGHNSEPTRKGGIEWVCIFRAKSRV